MKKCIFLVLLFVILIPTVMQAQQKLWINGIIFSTQDNGSAIPAPFAVIKMFDYNDRNKLLHMNITGLGGRYDFGENVLPQNYHVVIEAPGYQSKVVNIGHLPDKWDGNITFHFKMDKDDSADKPVLIKEIGADGFNLWSQEDPISSLAQITSMNTDQGELVTSTGETVLLLINGYFLDKDQLLLLLPEIKSEIIESIEVYEFQSDHFLFGAAVNIDVKGVNRSDRIISYIPRETVEAYIP